MSVLIRGMAMPETCKRCDFETDELLCDLTNDHTDDARKNRRLEGCPLVEVKEPHGDLIDRNQLVLPPEDIGSKFAVEYAPAVIEAEGAEE